ncbi:hypothetical protein Gotri_011426 [Gossypium trilobum]|uniref:Uncharacterized protein n=1 Tax=Gossypium trilobum TaxID=34281 RepID=A0A7J9EU82_9ROSI|nr:hypothetical protein [Gossypium trilobum]
MKDVVVKLKKIKQRALWVHRDGCKVMATHALVGSLNPYAHILNDYSKEAKDKIPTWGHYH